MSPKSDKSLWFQSQPPSPPRELKWHKRCQSPSIQDPSRPLSLIMNVLRYICREPISTCALGSSIIQKSANRLYLTTLYVFKRTFTFKITAHSRGSCIYDSANNPEVESLHVGFLVCGTALKAI